MCQMTERSLRGCTVIDDPGLYFVYRGYATGYIYINGPLYGRKALYAVRVRAKRCSGRIDQ